ncbi:GIP, partial [Symbiodinium sp. CCMP2456]
NRARRPTYRFKQSPVDSCMFFLYEADDKKQTHCAYLGVHVDDVLVAGEGELSESIRIDQKHYTDTRLFEVPVDKSQNDMEPATKEQRIDNQSLVGALSWRAEAHRHKGIWLKPVDLDNYEIFVYHENFALNKVLGMMTGTPYDFRERNAKKANSKVASQNGIMILIADRNCFANGGGECSLLEWRSIAGKIVCHSTSAAETVPLLQRRL